MMVRSACFVNPGRDRRVALPVRRPEPRRWLAAALVAIATFAAGCENNDAPTTPGEIVVPGSYRLGIRAADSCGPAIGAGIDQQFDATISQSGSSLSVTVASVTGYPTEGGFQGNVVGANVTMAGSVFVDAPASDQDYRASGMLAGSVDEDRIRGTLTGGLTYGSAVCQGSHLFTFTRR
jgi:hypothetical protein